MDGSCKAGADDSAASSGVQESWMGMLSCIQEGGTGHAGEQQAGTVSTSQSDNDM